MNGTHYFLKFTTHNSLFTPFTIYNNYAPFVHSVVKLKTSRCGRFLLIYRLLESVVSVIAPGISWIGGRLPSNACSNCLMAFKYSWASFSSAANW